MIITESLLNICHHTELHSFLIVMRTFKIYLQLPNAPYSIINRAVHHIPETYLSCTWKFVPSDHNVSV